MAALPGPHAGCFSTTCYIPSPVNYRHHFHAGNVADVFKHLVLTQVLEALRLKETPFCVIDTHAGSGQMIPRRS